MEFYFVFIFVLATGPDPLDPPSGTMTQGQTIDLLAELGIFNSSWPGVTLTPDHQQLRPAYYLQGNCIFSLTFT